MARGIVHLILAIKVVFVFLVFSWTNNTARLGCSAKRRRVWQRSRLQLDSLFVCGEPRARSRFVLGLRLASVQRTAVGKDFVAPARRVRTEQIDGVGFGSCTSNKHGVYIVSLLVYL